MPSGQALYDEEVTESRVSAVLRIWFLWLCNTHLYISTHHIYIIYLWLAGWKRFRTFWLIIRSLWAFEWDLVVTIEGVGLIRSLPVPVPDSLCFTCSPSPPTVESTSSSEPTNSPRLTSSRLYRRGAQCWQTHTGNSRASLPTGR